MSWSSNATEQGTKFFCEPGNYWLVVQTATEKFAAKTGIPMIELELTVVGHGVVVKENLMDPVACPKAKWRSDTFALAAGLAKEVGAPYTIDVGRLVGVRLYAELVIEPWVGNKGQPMKSSKVGRYIPVSEQPSDKPAVPPPAAKAPVAPYDPNSSDNIPF